MRTHPLPTHRAPALALLVLLLLGPASPAAATTGPLEILTQESNSIYGGEAWGISTDARFVVVWTPEDWVDEGPEDAELEDMYLWDRVEQTWTWVSPPATADEPADSAIPGGVMSADATTIAYALDPGDAFYLTVVDVASGVATRYGETTEDFPAISADGSLVAYNALVDGETVASVVDRASGEVTSYGPPGSRIGSISDDGTRLAYQVPIRQFFSQWFVVDLMTGEQTEIPAPNEAGWRDTSGQLSGDASVAFFVAVENDRRTIYRVDLTSGERTALLADLDNPFITDSTPAGERIIFTDTTPLAANDTNGVQDAHLLDVASGQVLRTSTTDEDVGGPQGVERLGTFVANDGVTTTFTSVDRTLVQGPLPPSFNAYVKTVDVFEPLAVTAPPTNPFERPALDGDPATTERFALDDTQLLSVAFSAARFTDGSAPYVALARRDEFADALAGTVLGDGPLLLNSQGALDEVVSDEIDRLLPDGGTVYVLGGPAAIAEDVVTTLTAAGYDVRRLAGPTRIETALAVADEAASLAGGPVDTVLLARGFGVEGNPSSAWADSVTGGVIAAAERYPLLLSPTEELHPSVAAWLTNRGVQRTILLGGEGALSAEVSAAVPGPERLAGETRAGTAAAISGFETFDSSSRRFLVINGFADDGWAFGLPAAGWAAEGLRVRAAPGDPLPILLAQTDSIPPETAAVISTCGDPQVDLYLLGGSAVLSGEVVAAADALDGAAC